jgi:hypothetical protein
VARHILDKGIQGRIAPVRLKALQALIFNDLAFSFYNQVEAAKITLSNEGAAVIGLREKDLDLWELYTRLQFEKDIQEQRGRLKRFCWTPSSAPAWSPSKSTRW